MTSDDDMELTFSSQERLTKSEATARKLALVQELKARGLDPALAKHADLSRSVTLKDLKAKVQKEKQPTEQKPTETGTKTREQHIQANTLDADTKPTPEKVMDQSKRQEIAKAQAMEDEIQKDAG
jgi:hypothetical protein